MTNLIASVYMLLVTNWTDVTPPVGFEQHGDYITWNDAKSKTTRLLGHVRTNQMARLVFDAKTNEMLLSEGAPFLEITREPTVTTTYSTNETVKPYQPANSFFSQLTNTYGSAVFVWPNEWRDLRFDTNRGTTKSR